MKIIELFTLHVLPRNEEWDYAHEFINLSEVLDEERKDLFLQTLDSLKEEKAQGELRAAALQREKDAELERQMRDAELRKSEEAVAAERQQNEHKHNTSEADRGMEKSRRNGSIKGRSSKSTDRQSGSKGRTGFSPPAGSSGKNVRKSEKPESRPRQIRALAMLRNLIQYISQSVTGNPLSFARALLFMLGIIMALSRQDVRERVRRITGAGWQKVKGTIGMGVKVSYI